MKPREPRRKVLINARMRVDNAWSDVCIRNISSRGLLAQTTSPPSRGVYIEIRRTRFVIIGRVVWRAGSRFGISTQERLDVDGIITDTAAPKKETQGAPGVERRGSSRPVTPTRAAEAYERSRQRSATMQFASFAIAGLTAAAALAYAVEVSLSTPLKMISSVLSGG